MRRHHFEHFRLNPLSCVFLKKLGVFETFAMRFAIFNQLCYYKKKVSDSATKTVITILGSSIMETSVDQNTDCVRQLNVDNSKLYDQEPPIQEGQKKHLPCLETVVFFTTARLVSISVIDNETAPTNSCTNNHFFFNSRGFNATRPWPGYPTHQ